MAYLHSTEKKTGFEYISGISIGFKSIQTIHFFVPENSVTKYFIFIKLERQWKLKQMKNDNRNSHSSLSFKYGILWCLTWEKKICTIIRYGSAEPTKLIYQYLTTRFERYETAMRYYTLIYKLNTSSSRLLTLLPHAFKQRRWRPNQISYQKTRYIKPETINRLWNGEFDSKNH